MDPEIIQTEQSKKPRKQRSDKGVKRIPYGPRKPRPEISAPNETSTESANASSN